MDDCVKVIFWWIYFYELMTLALHGIPFMEVYNYYCRRLDMESRYERLRQVDQGVEKVFLED